MGPVTPIFRPITFSMQTLRSTFLAAAVRSYRRKLTIRNAIRGARTAAEVPVLIRRYASLFEKLLHPDIISQNLVSQFLVLISDSSIRSAFHSLSAITFSALLSPPLATDASAMMNNVLDIMVECVESSPCSLSPSFHILWACVAWYAYLLEARYKWQAGRRQVAHAKWLTRTLDPYDRLLFTRTVDTHDDAILWHQFFLRGLRVLFKLFRGILIT